MNILPSFKVIDTFVYKFRLEVIAILLGSTEKDDIYFKPYQFSSVQLLSPVRLFVTTWIAAHQTSLALSPWCHWLSFSSCNPPWIRLLALAVVTVWNVPFHAWPALFKWFFLWELLLTSLSKITLFSSMLLFISTAHSSTLLLVTNTSYVCLMSAFILTCEFHRGIKCVSYSGCHLG